MLPIELNSEHRNALLIAEATRWLGVQESGGNNRGQLVELFQRAGKVVPGDPWCMAFVQYCIQHVDAIATTLLSGARQTKMPSGAHCLTVWNSTPERFRSQRPQPGSVVIWRHQDQLSGHTGIVSAVDNEVFNTIEGNTSPTKGVEREGDGVFAKSHSIKAGGPMVVVGFISPWGGLL